MRYAIVREDVNQKSFAVFHDTFEEAFAESSRLCAKEGKAFLILKVMGRVRPNYTPVIFEDEEEK